MSGIKYLLDTNFILGILKASPAVVAEISERKILAVECAYSAITRMELLGFPGITSAEDNLIRQKLECFTHVSLTLPIEDAVIKLRQTRKIKLPDAIIAATAIYTDVELLTLDRHLLAVINSFSNE
ncbi:MAG: type II toxin-antitoxin system VapC family toxin [Gallionella sp.]